MGLIRNPLCKICNSEIRDKIELMMIKGESSTKIIAFAKKHGLTINKANCSHHNRRHRLKAITEVRADASNKQAEKVQEFQLALEGDVQACLQYMVSEFHKKLIDNKLNPTVSDYLRAAELILKSGATSPIEKTLIQFIQGVHFGGPDN